MSDLHQVLYEGVHFYRLLLTYFSLFKSFYRSKRRSQGIMEEYHSSLDFFTQKMLRFNAALEPYMSILHTLL